MDVKASQLGLEFRNGHDEQTRRVRWDGWIEVRRKPDLMDFQRETFGICRHTTVVWTPITMVRNTTSRTEIMGSCADFLLARRLLVSSMARRNLPYMPSQLITYDNSLVLLPPFLFGWRCFPPPSKKPKSKVNEGQPLHQDGSPTPIPTTKL